MSKVLVLNATGKVGTSVVIALKEAGLDVYGTTRCFFVLVENYFNV